MHPYMYIKWQVLVGVILNTVKVHSVLICVSDNFHNGLN